MGVGGKNGPGQEETNKIHSTIHKFNLFKMGFVSLVNRKGFAAASYMSGEFKT